jgi:hypothetical protein
VDSLTPARTATAEIVAGRRTERSIETGFTA